MVIAKKSFKKQCHKNETELSKKYCNIKQENGVPIIIWKVLEKCHTLNQKKTQCILCLNKKKQIGSSTWDNL